MGQLKTAHLRPMAPRVGLRTKEAPKQSAKTPAATSAQAALSVAPDVVSSLSMQDALGNRGVAKVVQGMLNRVDLPVTVFEVGFNPESIVNDLRRAIDQSNTTVVTRPIPGVGAGSFKPVQYVAVRPINAALVIRALDELRRVQIEFVKQLYAAKSKRAPDALETDLFGNGESGFPSTLEPDERARILALLKGTRADRRGDDAPDARMEADAVELHQLLSGTLDEAARERVMALHRRPVGEIDRIDTHYQKKYSEYPSKALGAKLSGLALSRVYQLREGNWALADACAIEEKRRKIVALAESPVERVMEGATREERQKLIASIEAILEQNRQEALADPENAGKLAAQAINERLAAILAARGAEEGQTLGSQLADTLGSSWAASAVAPEADGVQSGKVAARRLAQMEASQTTTTEKLAGLLRGLRVQAEHDVVAWLADPWVADSDKQKALADPAAAIDARVKPYIDEFCEHYEAIRGKGRSYDAIVSSASDEYEGRLLRVLTAGGGRVPQQEQRALDADALEVALRNRNGQAVLGVLSRQESKADVDALVAIYDEKHHGKDHPERSLQRVLFGFQGDPELAAKLERQWTGAVLEGRTAARVQEQLERPAELGGAAEIDWMARSGQRERRAAEDNSGIVGAARELGDDPETQQIMAESARQLQELKAEWLRTDDPWANRSRGEILLEMRRVRATLTGDADAYEEENERIADQIRAAVSIAAQLVLAYALPGLGAGLVRFAASTAMNIGASVATNAVIYGDKYGWSNLRDDVVFGVVGTLGGKLGAEALGMVASRVVVRVGATTAKAAARAGIVTRLATELGSQGGSLGAITLASGENQFTRESLLQNLLGSVAGHFGQTRRDQAAAGKNGGAESSTPGEALEQVGHELTTDKATSRDGRGSAPDVDSIDARRSKKIEKIQALADHPNTPAAERAAALEAIQRIRDALEPLVSKLPSDDGGAPVAPETRSSETRLLEAGLQAPPAGKPAKKNKRRTKREKEEAAAAKAVREKARRPDDIRRDVERLSAQATRSPADEARLTELKDELAGNYRVQDGEPMEHVAQRLFAQRRGETLEQYRDRLGGMEAEVLENSLISGATEIFDDAYQGLLREVNADLVRLAEKRAELTQNRTSARAVEKPLEKIRDVREANAGDPRFGEHRLAESQQSPEHRELWVQERRLQVLERKLVRERMEIQREINRLELRNDARSAAYSFGDLGHVAPCFPPGTLVQTPEGPCAIEALRVGDLVIAWDFERRCLELRPILAVSCNWTEALVDLELAGETIQATREHPFWLEEERRFAAARELYPGAILRGIGGAAVLRRATVAPADSMTLNLEIAEHHNFHVGLAGVLVHNEEVESTSSLEETAPNFDDTTRRTTAIYEVIDRATGQAIYRGKTFQGDRGEPEVRFADHLKKKPKWNERLPDGTPRYAPELLHRGEWTLFEAAVWESHFIQEGLKKGLALENTGVPLKEQTFRKFKSTFRGC